MADMDILKRSFKGEIIRPGDESYESARSTYMQSGNPALIVRPTTARDVAAAVAYARGRYRVLSVRSGGHGGPGYGTNDGGMVIDLSFMNSVEPIDPGKGLVRIGPGATWGRVAGTLREFGLALSSGDTRTVGVGGLTLCGGIGWMVRKFGLTLDSLKAAEAVTADGRILRASPDENADLFWAIRGGGGNFGIVTNFEFEARPMGKVVWGSIGYDLGDASGTIRGWRDAMRNAPEELCSTLMVMPPFPGNPAGILVLSCYAGDDEEAAVDAVEPLLNLGTPVMKDIGTKDYPDILEDAHKPPEAIRTVIRNGFVRRFEDGLVEALGSTVESGNGAMIQLRSLGGAVDRVAPDETAFAHRGNEALLVYAGFVPAGTTDEAARQVMNPWEALAPYTVGAYANFLTTVSEEDVFSVYPKETYERLRAVKRKYDPENLFSLNCNIVP